MVMQRKKKLRYLEAISNLVADRDAKGMIEARETVEALKDELYRLQNSKGFAADAQSSEASDLWEEYRELSLARGFRKLAAETQAYDAAYAVAKQSRGRALVVRKLCLKL